MADNMRAVRFLPWSIGVAAVSVVVVTVIIGMSLGGSRPSEDKSRELSEFVMLSQKMPVEANSALTGSDAAFAALNESRTRYGGLLNQLGPQVRDVPAAGELLKQTQVVLGARQSVLDVTKAAGDVRALVPQVLQGVGNVAAALGPASVEGISRHLERFELTGARLQQDMQALAGGLDDAPATARRLADGIDYMGQVVGGLSGEDSGLGLPHVSGADAEQKLKSTSALYSKLSDKIRTAITSADRLRGAREASIGMTANSEKMYSQFGDQVGAAPVTQAFASPLLLLGLLGVALAALIALFVQYRMIGDIRKTVEVQANRNERNQGAILRLLDELSSLADGDLTVQATVTEDITGAIADSINYAIEALRELVATMNDTAVTLDASAKQTQTAAGHLAKASVAQSKQVALASESVAEMAASTEEVSGNAERSADVARHSVDVAHKGGDAVRRTIDGMNAIRETIQETSKRIKRLGESSQEIGNIVELINDIAEQTNILALNASIQASMAGEAGRGFAVVADEVQRLAERAANATKQIEVLVRTIQADTNEAVVSMERSTTDVVGGALLAENAGAALEEIEQVSNQIASLVQNISASSRQQASAAQNISRNMQVLREISSQSAESSAATSNSVGKLAELSTQLRKSIAGFRLPDAKTGGSELLQEPVKAQRSIATAVADRPIEKKVGLNA